MLCTFHIVTFLASYSIHIDTLIAIFTLFYLFVYFPLFEEWCDATLLP